MAESRVKRSKPAVCVCKIFAENIWPALFQHSLLTLYKSFVCYAKMDEYRIYRDKLTGGIIILSIAMYYRSNFRYRAWSSLSIMLRKPGPTYSSLALLIYDSIYHAVPISMTFCHKYSIILCRMIQYYIAMKIKYDIKGYNMIHIPMHCTLWYNHMILNHMIQFNSILYDIIIYNMI